ncbi:hypothetical protein [Bradyrhizobium sp.]|uniref:hypothetical protein n=1 Tax=Bradyrhizobium sp. TaxID=376 RepID=UPI0039E43AA5
MPTNLMRASAPPVAARSSARNVNIVVIALTAALVALQLVGLAILERSHAHAMQAPVSREPVGCPEAAAAPVPEIPYD